MVRSHTPKGKSIGGIGGAIEHTEVAIRLQEMMSYWPKTATGSQVFYFLNQFFCMAIGVQPIS